MAGSAAREGLTATLRSATQSAHRALDGRAILVELAEGTISARHYLQVLCAFGRIWHALEATAWTMLCPDMPALAALDDRRAPLLDADITALGGHIPAPMCDPPTITTPAQAAGVLYVLEGSRLGGALIADRLARAGRPLGMPGYRFFAPPPPGLGERWRRFRALLDAQDWSQAALDAASEAARATFAALGEALEAEQRHG
jgi:heme oxygenase